MLLENLNYRFSSQGLLERALTHRSAGSVNNERLEFLGDAILDLVISDWLFGHFENATEGQLSRLRASMVKRETLAALARELGLGDYLHMGAGEQRSGGMSRDSTLADAFEAIIAAIYLDGGIESAREVILERFHERLNNLDLTQSTKDPKTRLQEYLQGRGLSLPTYEITDTTGKQHEQRFTVRVEIADLRRSAVGEGRSRRKAEQAAAHQILEQINVAS